MKVRIYYNLTRKCWSIMDYKTKRVFDHAHRVIIHDAKEKISVAGMKRAVDQGRRNVHAFYDGELHGYDPITANKANPTPKPGDKVIRYNPFEGVPHFSTHAGTMMPSASALLFDTDARAKVITKRMNLGEV